MLWTILIYVGIFFLVMPVILGGLLIAAALLTGLIALAGSLLVSVARLEWTWWMPPWSDELEAVMHDF